MAVILKVPSGKTLQSGNAPWFYTGPWKTKLVGLKAPLR